MRVYKPFVRILCLAGLFAWTPVPASAVEIFDFRFDIQEIVLTVTDVHTGKELLFGHGAIPAPGTGYITNKGPDHDKTDILFSANNVTYYKDSSRKTALGNGTYSFNGWWGDTETLGSNTAAFGAGDGTLKLSGNPLGQSSIFADAMPMGFPSSAPTWEGELGALFGNEAHGGYVSDSKYFAPFYGSGIAFHSWWVGVVGNKKYTFDLHGYKGKCAYGSCGGGTEVPEPATLALLGSALLLPAAKRRRARVN